MREMNLRLGDWKGNAVLGCGLALALALLAWVMRDAAADQLHFDAHRN